VDLHDQSTDLGTTGLRNCVTWRQTCGEAASWKYYIPIHIGKGASSNRRSWAFSKIRGQTRPVWCLSEESANIVDNKPNIKLKADFGNLCSQWPNNIHVTLNVSYGHSWIFMLCKKQQMHINKTYFILSCIIIYFIKYYMIKYV